MRAFIAEHLSGPLDRLDRTLVALLRLVVIALFAGMTIVVVGQVFCRYVLGFSLNWSEEVARLSVICLVLLASALLARDGRHLTVTTVVDLLPPRARAVAATLAALIGLVAGSYLVRGAYAAFTREYAQRTPALQLPMGVVYGVITLAALLFCLFLCVGLVRNWRDILSNTHRTEGGEP
jgi:TRAP-type C4-dicarboxylate transport system permease small subunit